MVDWEEELSQNLRSKIVALGEMRLVRKDAKAKQEEEDILEQFKEAREFLESEKFVLTCLTDLQKEEWKR